MRARHKCCSVVRTFERPYTRRAGALYSTGRAALAEGQSYAAAETTTLVRAFPTYIRAEAFLD
jgi:hypothetical protein